VPKWHTKQWAKVGVLSLENVVSVQGGRASPPWRFASNAGHISSSCVAADLFSVH